LGANRSENISDSVAPCAGAEDSAQGFGGLPGRLLLFGSDVLIKYRTNREIAL
jgi:hypothetical protein